MKLFLTNLLTLACAAAPARAGELLAEAVTPGGVTLATVTLKVEGRLLVDRQGKPDAIPLTAEARVTFHERADAVGPHGRADRVTRHYAGATSASNVGLERTRRQLRPERRVVHVAPNEAQLLEPFRPAGPLTREELELVGEHFDTTALPALLPPGPVELNATWPVPQDAVQRLLHLEAVQSAALAGKLVTLDAARATIEVTGTAEGVELGSAVKATVRATVTFDRAANRVAEVNWTQSDVRGQGPASPKTELKAEVTIRRSAGPPVPPELAAVPPAPVPTPEQLLLEYQDEDGRYRLPLPRAWRVVGRTQDHLTLRLVEAGQFVAQATVSVWKLAAPGSHLSPGEFQAILAKLPGWDAGRVTQSGELPADAGRWLYRVATEGTHDNQRVTWDYYLLAGPGGEQAAVTVFARPEDRVRLGVRDRELVGRVEFLPRK